MLSKLPQLYQAFGQTVTTNLELREIIALARIAREIPRENIHNYVIDESYTVPWRTPQGAEVLIPNREKIAKLIEQIFGPPEEQAQQ